LKTVNHLLQEQQMVQVSTTLEASDDIERADGTVEVRSFNLPDALNIIVYDSQTFKPKDIKALYAASNTYGLEIMIVNDIGYTDYDVATGKGAN
jgi:hypothetical protein